MSPLIIRFALLLALCPAFLLAGKLVLPAPTLDRDAIVAVTYTMPSAVTGRGSAQILWTDSLGRTVESRTQPIELVDELKFSFPLDLRRAVAMKNTLRVHLSLDGKNLKGEPDRREEDAEITFIARPPDHDWWDYAVIMWQQYPRDQIPALQALGINGGQYLGNAVEPPASFADHNMRWYAENIATDFYAEYHRYRPDRIQHWSFLQAKELYAKDPTSKEAFKRHPSFWDPTWRAAVRERLIEATKRYAPYRPYFYDLGDESGIADLAAFWDFDFSDFSLVQMRRWLQGRYPSLAALNLEWGTTFTAWDLVTPPTTHEAMQRTDDNFTAWADFKEWMDISFADALRMGTDAVHEVDKDAFVAIAGGQMPSWGGYDYSRITKSITAIEPYDIGNSVEIIRSLNPAMPMLSTGFEGGEWEKHRVWRELLHGHRGLIIWDEKKEYVQNGQPGPRGKAAGAYYNEIRNGIGALLIGSQAVSDPIAIHYSQPSMRTEWMLARRPEGDAWVKRLAKIERTDNQFMRMRESWCRLIEDQGLQYRFVAYGQVEQGELLRKGYRVLVLPRSSALSQSEADAIRSFVAGGGTVIADGEPGVFNERSKRLAQPLLADLFSGTDDGPLTVRAYGKGKAVFVQTDTLEYHQNRLVKKEGSVHTLMNGLFQSLGVRPEFAVTDAAGKPPVGVEMQVYRNGGTQIVTLLSNPQMRVDELGPADFQSNGRFEQPVPVTLTLPGPMHVYDVRGAKSLGLQRKLALTVNPYEPIVLTVTPVALPELRVNTPLKAKRGTLAQVGLASPGTSAATHIYHVEVVDPHGQRHLHYSGNLRAENGSAVKVLPLAENDEVGKWILTVRDLLSGQTSTLPLEVK